MSQSLANKYRPKDFESVCGQNSIVKILQRQIYLKEYKHSYLFTGPSGTGKTTLCRLLASKINGSSNGIIEVDAASNNGVENVRNIVKSARERSINSKYKIYIVDECHMTTISGWNSFLKCIEEPPEYTIFMFCTTNPEKIPPTIINRCQRYNLSKISTNKIIERLSYICEQEGFTNYKETVEYISKLSDGGMRDAISNLEKVASYNTDFNIKTTLEVLGEYSYDLFFKLVNNIVDSKCTEVLQTISEVYYKGDDLKIFTDKFFNFCLDVTKYSLFKDMNLLTIPKSLQQELDLSTNFENASQYYMIIVDKLLNLKTKIRNDTDIRPTVEATFLNIARWE